MDNQILPRHTYFGKYIDMFAGYEAKFVAVKGKRIEVKYDEGENWVFVFIKLKDKTQMAVF